MIIRNWFNILFFISLISLSSALVAEYYFNLQPCELCLKQRHPYYFFIFSIIITYLIKNSYKFYSSLLNQVASLYGIFYSVWHVGVENKILKGPAGCSSNLSISSSTSELKEQIFNKQVISCDEVVWSLFGLSAASINTLVLLFIFIINAIYIYRYYDQKKQKNI